MSPVPGLGSMTLREKLRDTNHRLTELHEHLDQSFVPKVHELRKMFRPTMTGHEAEWVADSTIHSQVATVLESEDYTLNLHEQASALLASIIGDVEAILKGELKQR